jgi:TRAP-type C4-dicarboxylate transport system permease small subunit
MSLIKNVDGIINRFCQYFSGALLGVIAVVCALQVFCRYVLNNSLSWSEEIMRYLFIWLVMFATTITVKHGSGASVDIFAGLFRRHARRLYALILYAALAVGGIVFIIFGWRMTVSTMPSLSAALRIPMGYVYLCVPVSGAIIVLHCITAILDEFTAKKEDEKI